MSNRLVGAVSNISPVRGEDKGSVTLLKFDGTKTSLAMIACRSLRKAILSATGTSRNKSATKGNTRSRGTAIKLEYVWISRRKTGKSVI